MKIHKILSKLSFLRRQESTVLRACVSDDSNRIIITFAALLLFFTASPAYAQKNLDSATFELKDGVSLESRLENVGISPKDAADAVAGIAKVYEIKKFNPGQRVKVSFEIMDDQGQEIKFSAMEIKLSSERKIHVSRLENGALSARMLEGALQPKLMYVHATVGSTLFSAARNAGISHEMFNEFVKAYSYDVDFQRDIRSGDEMEVLYEAVYDEDGNLVSDGEILYISLDIQKGKFTLYNYTTPDGKSDYYAKNGQSVQKPFLRTPVNGARISSKYGRRKHPVLGYSKLHKGIDFAAPKGTPVYAAGDGVIKEMRRKGSYGRYIKIYHNETYSTAYAHLNGFAKKLKRGSTVSRGQVIGYVGSSGRSTGAHLHYEVHKQNKHANPLSIEGGAGKKLAGGEKKLFVQYRDSLMGAVERMAEKSREPERKVVELRLPSSKK